MLILYHKIVFGTFYATPVWRSYLQTIAVVAVRYILEVGLSVSNAGASNNPQPALSEYSQEQGEKEVIRLHP